MRRPTSGRLSIAAAFVAVFALTAGCASSHTKPIGTSISITAMNGHTIQETKVTKVGGGFAVLPEIVYHDNSPEDGALEQRLIDRGLGNVADLRSWWLCAPVLHDQSVMLTETGRSMLNDPNDAPYDYGKSMPSDQRAIAESDVKDAAIYAHAAVLAQQAQIPCFEATLPLGEAHWVVITGHDRYGTRTISIPDYRAVADYTPLEWLALNHQCTSYLQGQLRSTRKTPLSKYASKKWRDPEYVYDAWQKSSDTIESLTEIKEALLVPVPC